MSVNHPDELDKESFCLGSALVDPARNRITRDGQSHRVTPRDMEVLMCLVKKGPHVISRKEILEKVWGDTIVQEEVLTLAISRLRSVFSDDSKKPQIIETIPKRGYRLMTPAQPWEKERKSEFRSLMKTPAFWVSLLAVLLVVMTSLFLIVRAEYEKVSMSQEPASQEAGIVP